MLQLGLSGVAYFGLHQKQKRRPDFTRFIKKTMAQTTHHTTNPPDHLFIIKGTTV